MTAPIATAPKGWVTVRPQDGSPAYHRPLHTTLADGLNDPRLWDGRDFRRIPA